MLFNQGYAISKMKYDLLDAIARAGEDNSSYMLGKIYMIIQLYCFYEVYRVHSIRNVIKEC